MHHVDLAAGEQTPQRAKISPGLQRRRLRREGQVRRRAQSQNLQPGRRGLFEVVERTSLGVKGEPDLVALLTLRQGECRGRRDGSAVQGIADQVDDTHGCTILHRRPLGYAWGIPAFSGHFLC